MHVPQHRCLMRSPCLHLLRRAAKEATTKPDPLLGKWVCLANNADEFPNGTMDFRSDGTVVIQWNDDKAQTIRYKREPAKEWAARRPKGGAGPEIEAQMPWNQPGVEAVYFEGPDGEFMDYGGHLLMLDPQGKTLSNPITFLWCRPGDEARVRKLSGMDADKAQQKKEEEQRQAWRPKKDVTKQWRLKWKVDLPGKEVGAYWVTAGDTDGDGMQEAVVSDTTGFRVISNDGHAMRHIPLGDKAQRLLAVGQSAGAPLVIQFETWGSSLTAYDMQGQVKWRFGRESSPGIDWVAPVRTDSKNTGFVIGYNGGGIEFIGPTGKDVWHAGVDTNVWSVSGARLAKGAAEGLLCVGPGGALAYDADGERLQEYEAQQVGAVGAADLDGDGIDEVLTLGTTLSSGMELTVFGANGKRQWSKKGSDSGSAFVDGAPFVSGEFNKQRLVGVADAVAIRFFRPDGSHFGDFMIPGGIQSVAKLSGKGVPDALLVRVYNQLRCYELR
jgi:hypothetical protein